MYYKTIEKTVASAKGGSKFGLTRTRSLLDALGAPDLGLKIVHIAGTNGKGSTAHFITNVLRSAGKRVGTFCSPAVYDYGEQFLTDGAPLPKGRLESYLAEADAEAEKLADGPTAFERETAAALYAFKQEGCEYAVIECGLGGDGDATNAIAQKSVAVITSVSLEHTAVLGNTVTEICRRKSGIIINCPAVVSALQSQEGRRFFERLGVTFAGDGLKITVSDLSGQKFIYGGKTYKIAMLGKAQCYNACTAIEACRLLGVGEKFIADGLEKTRLAGRCELAESAGVTYILDGAHNPASFAPLEDVLARSGKGARLVFGCLSDKDVNAVAEEIAPLFKSAVLVSPPSWRAMELKQIVNAFAGRIEDIKTARSVAEALDVTQGGNAGADLVVICGSFTVLKEAREWIEKRQ